jgi:hypothetical protein
MMLARSRDHLFGSQPTMKLKLCGSEMLALILDLQERLMSVEQ